jgi:hypothetical protein
MADRFYGYQYDTNPRKLNTQYTPYRNRYPQKEEPVKTTNNNRRKTRNTPERQTKNVPEYRRKQVVNKKNIARKNTQANNDVYSNNDVQENAQNVKKIKSKCKS